MPFDDPACFRLARLPVRPIHWLWRPYLDCGNPALRDGVQVGSADGAEASLRPDAGAGQAAPWRGRSACAEGRPNAQAMVRSRLAARRRMTPLRVRPTDPRRAPCRPYGLGRRRIRGTDGTSRDRKGGVWPLIPATFAATSATLVVARVGDADCRNQKLRPAPLL